VPLYRDEAVVLRTRKLGEADRIVTLFTQRRGLVHAVAKGIRRTKSRFGARLEPFSVVDLQCYEGRSLDTVTQAESIALYGPTIGSDFDKYRAAWVIVETAERLADAEPSAHQFHLLVGALRSLANDLAPWMLVRDAYLLRSLGLAGWTPGLHECLVCGAEGPHEHVVIGLGGVVCEQCRRPGAIHLRQETLALLIALLRGDWDQAVESSESTRTEAAGFTAAYAQWQLERGLKSLKGSHRQRLGPTRSATSEP
jgi:DNA repair protein RecO (recombination protein O)